MFKHFFSRGGRSEQASNIQTHFFPPWKQESSNPELSKLIFLVDLLGLLIEQSLVISKHFFFSWTSHSKNKNKKTTTTKNNNNVWACNIQTFSLVNLSGLENEQACNVQAPFSYPLGYKSSLPATSNCHFLVVLRALNRACLQCPSTLFTWTSHF